MSAVYHTTTGVLVVAMDRPLASATLDRVAWVVERQVHSRIADTAAAFGTTISIATHQTALGAPHNQVTYDGTDPLLTGDGGTPVAAFTLAYSDVP